MNAWRRKYYAILLLLAVVDTGVTVKFIFDLKILQKGRRNVI